MDNLYFLSNDREFAWRSDLIDAPNPLDLLSVAFVRDSHLRIPNYGVEDDYIEFLIRTVYSAAERVSRRALLPQTRQMVMDHFPIDGYLGWSGMALGYLLPGMIGRRQILIPVPPLIEVTEISYLDLNGDEQVIDPANYTVSIPRGPRAKPGYVIPAPITRPWPLTVLVPDAVKITYRAGYAAVAGSPDFGSPVGSPPPTNPRTEVPMEIVAGMLLGIGEMYRTRSESIDSRMTPGINQAKMMWKEYRAYL